jgi:hypothetical protein
MESTVLLLYFSFRLLMELYHVLPCAPRPALVIELVRGWMRIITTSPSGDGDGGERTAENLVLMPIVIDWL